MSKIFWYIEKLLIFGFVCIRLFFYCLVHPKKFFELFFILFSNINAFYQSSIGRLLNFNESKIYDKIQETQVFAKTNVFNVELEVARPMETQILSSLVSYFKPRTVFEIGTYTGFTAMHFTLNSPESSIVYTLDLPENFQASQDQRLSYDDKLVIKLSTENIHRRIFKNTPQEQKIVELFGDSKTFDFSPYYGKIDFIYVDGNHSHDYVQSDTENAMKMLSDHGVIVWHDYDYIIHRDVFKYLNKLSKEYKIYSIPHTRFAIYGKNLE